MSNIRFHVGYIGRTRDDRRVVIVRCRNSPYFMWLSDTCETYTTAGSVFLDALHSSNIVGPWVDEQVVSPTNYHNGEWWGWNGSKCPVHPKTIVDCGHMYGMVARNVASGNCDWDNKNTPIIVFRVVKVYIEQPKPREWWIYCYCAYDKKPDWTDESIHVREVLDT